MLKFGPLAQIDILVIGVQHNKLRRLFLQLQDNQPTDVGVINKWKKIQQK